MNAAALARRATVALPLLLLWLLLSVMAAERPAAAYGIVISHTGIRRRSDDGESNLINFKVKHVQLMKWKI